MSDRGMKKWQPFKALSQQDEVLDEIIKQKNKKERPRLSEDQIEKIQRNLVLNEELSIKYYTTNEVKEEKGVITKIDPYQRKLTINRKSILFIDLIDIDKL